MTATRLSRLQQQRLRWLHADERRARGVIASRHQALVQAVPSAKGTMSHSLRLLETRGLMRLGRSPGGRAESVTLTTAAVRRLRRWQEVLMKGSPSAEQGLVISLVERTSPRPGEGYLVKASRLGGMMSGRWT